MKTLAEFEADFGAAVGVLSSLVDDGDVERWVNEGRTRIGIFDKKRATITWDAGDLEAALPADFISLAKVRAGTTGIPAFSEWGKNLVFDSYDGASAAGEAVIFYNAYFAEISDAAASELPEEGDRGLLSYALYRFFQKLSANRVDYRRYSTLVGQNAVGIEDLQAEATRQYDDFLDAGASLPPSAPVFFHERSG